jgi:hypothetical protein
VTIVDLNQLPRGATRDDLPPIARAVCEALEEWTHRVNGILGSNTRDVGLFLDLLAAAGLAVVDSSTVRLNGAARHALDCMAGYIDLPDGDDSLPHTYDELQDARRVLESALDTLRPEQPQVVMRGTE